MKVEKRSKFGIAAEFMYAYCLQPTVGIDLTQLSLCFFFPAKEKEQELEQLTKELRQVNLQQFIQQTGTKVTVLPAQPTGENNNGKYTHTNMYIDMHVHTSRDCMTFHKTITLLKSSIS